MIRIPHLETDVTQACQLSCVGCNHSVPLWRKRGPWRADPDQVNVDLNHLATFLHAEKWGALGGEPFLNRDLAEICSIARASRIADVIEIWTNGLMLKDERSPWWEHDHLWRSFDHLVVSMYPGKFTDEEASTLQRRVEERGIVFIPKDERHHPNFRTMLEPVPTDPEATRRKFRGCFFRQFSRCASYGYFFTCCCGPHLPMLMQGQPFGTDGVRIEGSTELEIKAYLERSEPLGACTICAGRDTAKPLAWHEERNPERWMKESAGG